MWGVVTHRGFKRYKLRPCVEVSLPAFFKPPGFINAEPLVGKSGLGNWNDTYLFPITCTYPGNLLMLDVLEFTWFPEISKLTYFEICICIVNLSLVGVVVKFC